MEVAGSENCGARLSSARLTAVLQDVMDAHRPSKRSFYSMSKRSYDDVIDGESKALKTGLALNKRARVAVWSLSPLRLATYIASMFHGRQHGKSKRGKFQQRQARRQDSEGLDSLRQDLEDMAPVIVGDLVEVSWLEEESNESLPINQWHLGEGAWTRYPAVVRGFDEQGNLKIEWLADGAEDICPLAFARRVRAA